MLSAIHPKLPMRNKKITQDFYVNQLGFENNGSQDYPDYLMLSRDQIEVHFFLFKELNPEENYGQVYIRTTDIQSWYNSLVQRGVAIHPHGKLEKKPWGLFEFSILDPDTNLITFGEAM